MAERALFVSPRGFLDAPIRGGVQVCSAEFAALLETAGYELALHQVEPRRGILARGASRLGLEVYARYRFEREATAIAALADRAEPVVFLNQMELGPIAGPLRQRVPGAVIVMLSHGNESGDYLHQRLGVGAIHPLHARWRLGALLAREAALFRDVDLVLCLSETEEAINRWLGAGRVVVVPRTFAPKPIAWQPMAGRAGIVATLDHHPNLAGIDSLASAMADNGIDNVVLRLTGGGAGVGRALQQRFPFVEYLGQLDDAALEAEAATWSLFVHPLFWFARGASTKIATAINWGLPIATTPAGVRGYRWRAGGVALAGDAVELARLVQSLVHNPARSEQLRADVLLAGRSGPALAELGGEVGYAIASIRASRRR